MKTFFTFKIAVLSSILVSFLVLPTFGLEGWRYYILSVGGDPGFIGSLANGISLVTDLLCISSSMGFVLLGRRVGNKLLTISSAIIVAFGIVLVLANLVMMVVPSIYLYENVLVSVVVLILVGVLGILFGIGLLQGKGKIGVYATPAGILSIIVGGTFVFYFTATLGMLLAPPLMLLEVLILDRAAQKYES